MQVLEIVLDVSAVTIALGAGAALFQISGKLRSAEAKRNALQTRLTELEQQRTKVANEADSAFAAVQVSNQRNLETAHRRVEQLEKALETALKNAEQEQALSIQRVEALEKRLALEQAKAVRREPLTVPAQPVVTPAEASVEFPETVPVRVPAKNGKKATSCVLVAASRESKTANEMEKHLTEAGYKVVRATSVDNALKTAQESRPDLVTLDSQLSGGDNLEALEKFKADAELRDIPIVVICSLKDREKAIEMGAAGCVVPPVTSNVLLGTVKTAFINHRKRMERSRLAKTANTGSAGAPTANDRSTVLSGVE